MAAKIQANMPTIAQNDEGAATKDGDDAPAEWTAKTRNWRILMKCNWRTMIIVTYN